MKPYRLVKKNSGSDCGPSAGRERGVPEPVVIGDCTLYCGDCLEILPELEAGSVDAVVTDPPYGNNYSTGHRKGIYRPSTRITGDILSEPLLNDVAPIYWFAAPDRLDMVLPILKRWNVVNVLCWDKLNCTAGDLECSYGKQWEACVFAVAGKSPLIGGRDRDVIRMSRGNSAEYVHPTQKPVGLMKYLIGRHDAACVLDPFMGSGTTGVACIKTGRKFIGIEKEPKYFDIACRRIREAYASQSLFRQPDPPSGQQAELIPTT